MKHRPLTLAAALGLLVSSQASMAVLLTTPAQSVDFCVGFCSPVFTDGILQQKKLDDGPLTSTKDVSVKRSFGTFNPALGILRSVSFTLTSTIVGSVFAVSTVDELPGVKNEFSLLVDPKLSLLGFDVLLDDAELPSLLVQAINPADKPTGSAGGPRNASKTLAAPPTNLSFFTTGSSFDAEFLHTMTLSNSRLDNTTLTGNATWSGKLNLQYAYEERPTESVPEPGTLALVGLGLLSGVAGLRKRNSKAG